MFLMFLQTLNHFVTMLTASAKVNDKVLMFRINHQKKSAEDIFKNQLSSKFQKIIWKTFLVEINFSKEVDLQKILFLAHFLPLVPFCLSFCTGVQKEASGMKCFKKASERLLLYQITWFTIVITTHTLKCLEKLQLQ